MSQTNKNTTELLIKNIFKQFCQETGRSGGVLVHASIGEWHKYLAEKLKEHLGDQE